jgi:hypothetical protein
MKRLRTVEALDGGIQPRIGSCSMRRTRQISLRDANLVTVRKSNARTSRHFALTDEGAGLLTILTAGGFRSDPHGPNQ